MDAWPRKALTPSSSPEPGSTPASGGVSSSSRQSRRPDEDAAHRGPEMRRGTSGPWDDDDAQTRVYDARLARRVWGFTRPYRGAVGLSAALFPLLAVVDIAQPYLV